MAGGVYFPVLKCFTPSHEFFPPFGRKAVQNGPLVHCFSPLFSRLFPPECAGFPRKMPCPGVPIVSLWLGVLWNGCSFVDLLEPAVFSDGPLFPKSGTDPLTQEPSPLAEAFFFFFLSYGCPLFYNFFFFLGDLHNGNAAFSSRH